jgi:glycine cleavage system H lipoate-binding protein
MADGWLFKMKPADPSELNKLMSHEDYQKFLEEADN